MSPSVVMDSWTSAFTCGGIVGEMVAFRIPSSHLTKRKSIGRHLQATESDNRSRHQSGILLIFGGSLHHHVT